MYKFSKNSKLNLAQCRLDIQTIFNEVIKMTDCSIICGHRGEKEQNKAFDKGFSKLKYPKSKHNSCPSLAIDVVPYPIDWNDIPRFFALSDVINIVQKELYKKGLIKHKLEWGGNWSRLRDYPHYQLDL